MPRDDPDEAFGEPEDEEPFGHEVTELVDEDPYDAARYVVDTGQREASIRVDELLKELAEQVAPPIPRDTCFAEAKRTMPEIAGLVTKHDLERLEITQKILVAVEGIEQLTATQRKGVTAAFTHHLKVMAALSPSGDQETQSAATTLIRMGLDNFEFINDFDGQVFAVDKDGPNLAIPLRGRGLLKRLLRLYFTAEGEAAPANALNAALGVLEALAEDNPRQFVALRVFHDTEHCQIVLDLGDADGHAVAIRPNSWEVVERSPVVFRRTSRIKPLPIPERGGNLSSLLRPLVTLSDRDFDLLMGWMASWFFHGIPRPIPFLSGEAGTAKTTTANVIHRTVDGAANDAQAPPRKEDDLMVGANSAYTLSLDNVATISPWLSDALCRLCTGAGWLKRQLYTDADLIEMRFRRSVILNGINPRIARGDLVERIIRFDLDVIEEDARLTDEEVTSAFSRDHPKILGALCTLVSQVLAELAHVRVIKPPRMYDFARVVAALDKVRNTNALDRYRELLGFQLTDLAEDDPFADVIRGFISAQPDGTWTGAARKLLETIEPLRPDPLPEDWPTTPELVAQRLLRLAPPLRRQGIDCRQLHRTGRSRQWSIRTIGRGRQ